jgi:hypothetical protein
MAQCPGQDGKDGPDINQPGPEVGNPTGPTGDACTAGSNVRATCGGKEAGRPDVAKAETGDEIVWRSAEDAASLIVDDHPDTTLSPSLVGAVSTPRTPPQAPIGAGSSGTGDTTVRDPFPFTDGQGDTQGGGQVHLPTTNPVVVVPGFGVGVDLLDLDRLGQGTVPTGKDPFLESLNQESLNQQQPQPDPLQDQFDRCGALC